MDTTLASIILFVYNRPWHTQQTLVSLMANELADQSTLYIYCDGPKNDALEEDLKNIKEVRTLIRKKNWCKKVVIIERDENLGLANSVIQGVTEIIERHGKVIVLEDDIVTGKYFLKFMNDALYKYESEKKVFGVSGYKYPSIKNITAPTYFLPISSSWSFATWLDRWNRVNFNGEELLKDIEKRALYDQLDFGGNSFFQMLKDQILGMNDSWAIRFYVSMFLEKSYFLYPNKSLIQNIGFDNSGTHCGNDDYYTKSELSNEKIKLFKIKVKLNSEVVKNINKSFQENFKRKSPRTFTIKKLTLKFLRKMNLNRR